MRWLRGLIACVVLAWPIAGYAASGPVAPCGPDAVAYPAFADPPNVRTWRAAELPAGWAPGGCVAWAARPFTVLTALAGRFRFAGTADDLLARFGAQSAWRGITYWSVLDRSWNVLIRDAAALAGNDGQQRRADFTAAEMKAGAEHYFLQQDNRSSGAVVYRLTVVAVAPDRLAVGIENVSPVTFMLFTLFAPGNLKSTYILEKLGPDAWGYYSLSGAREGFSVIGEQDSSYVNRAAAIYRHLAGIPGNQEPPLAR